MSVQHYDDCHSTFDAQCSTCRILSLLKKAKKVCEEARKVLEE